MVKKVDIYGKQAKKVYVEFSHQRLAALGITPLQIAESLRNQNSVLASGSIDTRGDRVLVRVSGQFTSLDDIRNVPIAAGGRLIKLGDFTTITRGYEDPPTYTVRHNGQQVLMLGITMTNDGNIVDLGKAIEKAVAKVQAELPYGVELERVADQPTVVSESIWEFERSLMEALAIVLAVCLLSLGWRTGIVVGLSVPIVLGVVALVMLAMGWNLERVSLGSLIIALGLLVDDGIIAVEMMVVKMEEGWDRLKAAAYLVRGDRDAAADRRARSPSPPSCRSASPSRPPASTRAASSGSSARPCCSRGSSRGSSRPTSPSTCCRRTSASITTAATRTTRRSTASCAAGSTSPSSGAGGSSAPPSPHWPSRSSEAGSCRSSSSPTARGPSWSSSCD